jgi:hypothetical protein
VRHAFVQLGLRDSIGTSLYTFLFHERVHLTLTNRLPSGEAITEKTKCDMWVGYQGDAARVESLRGNIHSQCSDIFAIILSLHKCSLLERPCDFAGDAQILDCA